MNERIRELMGNTLDEKFAGTWSTMDMLDLINFSERFAELIVRECMEELENDTRCRIAGADKIVAKHFGVEP